MSAGVGTIGGQPTPERRNNATLGWSWADPMVGLVIAAVAAREQCQAWRGEGCCAPPAAAPGETDATRSGAESCSADCGCGHR